MPTMISSQPGPPAKCVIRVLKYEEKTHWPWSHLLSKKPIVGPGVLLLFVTLFSENAAEYVPYTWSPSPLNPYAASTPLTKITL